MLTNYLTSIDQVLSTVVPGSIIKNRTLDLKNKPLKKCVYKCDKIDTASKCLVRPTRFCPRLRVRHHSQGILGGHYNLKSPSVAFWVKIYALSSLALLAETFLS